MVTGSSLAIHLVHITKREPLPIAVHTSITVAKNWVEVDHHSLVLPSFPTQTWLEPFTAPS